MAIRGKPKGGFAGEFQREMLKARKKAGRKVGGLVAREYRKGLGKTDPRRKKAVRHLTGKEGRLVVLDLAPLAVAQDQGKTIRAKRPEGMLIRTGESFDRSEKMYRSQDGKYLFQGNGKNRKLLGTYRQQIKIDKRPEHQRLVKVAEKQLDRYADEIDKNIYKG